MSHQAKRGDEVEAWLKRLRDQHHNQASGYTGDPWWLLDDALEDYRLHADTGTPLSEDVEVR